MYSIRGAITISEDNEEEIISSTKLILKEMIEKNNVAAQDIVSIIFTATDDIKSCYPAKAARQLGITRAGLLNFKELDVRGSMRMCIRVLMLVNGDKAQSEAVHVYLRDAAKLRPDLAKKINLKMLYIICLCTAFFYMP